MLLYYITDRRGFPGGEAQQRVALLEKIGAAAKAGVDYIELREKDLSPRALEVLARETVQCIRENSPTVRLLINGRADMALACGADGVHLPSGEPPATEIRALWMRTCNREPVIATSSHSLAEIRSAEVNGADFAVLAPIFEKVDRQNRESGAQGIGLDVLRSACSGEAAHAKIRRQNRFSVLALGGVTVTNARDCLLASAAGVAGIRLFQHGDVAETVRSLRRLCSQV